MIHRWLKERLWPRARVLDGFSIVCAYNDRGKLERFLLRSLEGQSAPFELLLIDTRAGGVKSAPPILNEAAKRARFDHLVFVHQDVALGSPHWLEDVRAALEKLGRYGAAGVAGRAEGGLFASVLHGDPPQPVGTQPVTGPQPVQTLDGCLMIVPRAVFLEQGFDETTCRGWHFYVADYCLDLAERGLDVFVLPNGVYHESMGPADPSVYQDAKRALLKKHRRHKTLYLTMGVWETADCDEAS